MVSPIDTRQGESWPAVPDARVVGAQAVFVDARTITVPQTLGAAGASRHPTAAPLGRRQATQQGEWVLVWSQHATARVLHGDGRARLEGADHLVELAVREAGLDEQQRALHPDQADRVVLALPRHWRRSVPEMLTGQLLVGRRREGRLVALTGVQLGPVLDTVHAPAAREQHLGLELGTQRVALRLWAPTAQRVTLLLWPQEAGACPPVEQAERRTMLREADGTWTTRVPREQLGARYLYEVVVYSPATGRLETNLVTDPYSAGLTVDSGRSVLVDLDDPAAMPDGWADSHGPRLEKLVDAQVYELHVRDFSAHDELVPAELRGSYQAFAVDGHGSRHLRRLAAAGLNTVHLLPCFDITSVPEANPAASPGIEELAALPPDSIEQQRLVARRADDDGYNWGYDPYHWGVPEGSYASSPQTADGLARVAEFRTMVHALHQMGLRVVMDQVFTHTGASGQHAFSVLDRIVPGYYHRLDAMGVPQSSTCGNNVATERVMAEKVMADMVVRWARSYHVDGFRFDLMGHSSVQNMRRVREALDALTAADDGVDGRAVNLYGEGWNFGEVADNALFTQAIQGQLDGTGIATFNDRIRDAVRGGQPFDEDPRRQGFATGLAGDLSGARCNRNPDGELAHAIDLLMLGLVGNLADYPLPCTDGVLRRGDEVAYAGRPAGYAREPYDVINYVDAHDNETLWDALTLKLPRHTTMAERVRMNTLALACVTLGQAPFLWHAGADLLRSKSLDRNSYNSGDWFNTLDWTGRDNGFGHGLPPAADNMTRWPWLKPLLADASLKPSADDVAQAAEMAHDLLRIRRSLPLLRLGSGNLVRTKVRFPAAGTVHAAAGAVVMHVDDRLGEPTDAELAGVVVVFNPRPQPVRATVPGLDGQHLELCRVQREGHDEVVKGARQAELPSTQGPCSSVVLEVPARTVAVFTHPR